MGKLLPMQGKILFPVRLTCPKQNRLALASNLLLTSHDAKCSNARAVVAGPADSPAQHAIGSFLPALRSPWVPYPVHSGCQYLPSVRPYFPRSVVEIQSKGESLCLLDRHTFQRKLHPLLSLNHGP